MGCACLEWSWLCRHACVWRRCSSRSSGGGCACASRKAAGGSGDTGCPAQGRDNADAGSAAGVSVPDPSAGAKRVCGPAIRSTRCGRPPAVGIQVPQRAPARAVRMYRYLSSMVWKVCRRNFFRMSMTPSFSSSFLRSARISASSSRRRLASRFWRSACPGDGAPAAFSQLRSVSMQMPSSAATSRLGRPCSVTIRTAPALKASS